MKVCGHCGYNNNPDEAMFCTSCGANLADPEQKNSNHKGCIGCLCAAVIVFLLIIGGLGWWFYEYVKKQDKEVEETIEWLNKGQKEWEAKRLLGEQDPDNQTYNGRSVRKLAEEQDFPAVNYGELPKEGRVYQNNEGNVTIRFASINFTEGDYIGTLTISLATGRTAELWVSPCGCSIYHLTNPDDTSEEHGYFFVEKGVERILYNDEEGTQIEMQL